MIGSMPAADSSPKYHAAEPFAYPRLRPARFAIWLLTAILLAAALAWCATKVTVHFAPLVVFPVALGIALGAGLAWTLRLFDTAHRPSLLAGTIVAGLVLVVGRHYGSYLATRDIALITAADTVLAAQAFPELQARLRNRGRTFPQFLRDSANHGTELFGIHLRPTGIWLMWGFDAALSIGITTTWVAGAQRRPFCDTCGSWYRVSRSGRVDSAKSTAILRATGLQEEPRADASYRVWSCRSGCERIGFELSYSEPDAGPGVTWLDRGTYAVVVSVLDALVPAASIRPPHAPQTSPNDNLAPNAILRKTHES
jgi:hypothetical protein